MARRVFYCRPLAKVTLPSKATSAAFCFLGSVFVHLTHCSLTLSLLQITLKRNDRSCQNQFNEKLKWLCVIFGILSVMTFTVQGLILSNVLL